MIRDRFVNRGSRSDYNLRLLQQNLPLADIAPTGRGIALERGYLCEMHRFIAMVACEE